MMPHFFDLCCMRIRTIAWGWAVVVAACGVEDVEPPEWQVVVNGEAPGGHLALEAGDLIAFTADASDDVALERSVVRMAPFSDDFQVVTGEWFPEKEVGLEGRQALVGHNWVVPDSLVGTWRLTAELVDASGQTAVPVTYNLTFSNPFSSAVALDSLLGLPAAALPPVPVAAAGDPLLLVGTVFDADGLNAVRVDLETNGGDVLASWEWPTPGGLVCDLAGAQLSMPSDASTGLHWLRIRVMDGSLTPTHAYVALSIPD